MRRAAVIVLRDKPKWAAFKTECSLGYCRQTVAGQTCRWLSLPFVVVGRWVFWVWQSALHSHLMIYHDIVWLFTLSWQKNHFDLQRNIRDIASLAPSYVFRRFTSIFLPLCFLCLKFCALFQIHMIVESTDCLWSEFSANLHSCLVASKSDEWRREEQSHSRRHDEFGKRYRTKEREKMLRKSRKVRRFYVCPKRKAEWDGWLWW